MPRHARPLLLSVGALALGLTGCGGSVPEGAVDAAAVECPSGSECYDVPRAVGDGGAFSVDAGEFFFDNITGVFWAGDIEITLDNVGAAEHNIVFIGANEGSDDPVAQALGGESDSGTVNLFEGDYVYYCSIPGHRSQGMEGTLTVHPTQEQAEEELAADPEVEISEGAGGDDGATESESPDETESPTAEPTETDTEG